MTNLLWRIDPTAPGVAHVAHLAADLALHLRYAPLTTVLVQIGSRQQAYLTGTGCAGCQQQRCGPDCVMQLVRRALIANQAATDVRPVPLGLTAQPYTRLVLAIPGPHAQALDATLLAPWHAARLWASWRTIFGRQMVGVALAVGSDGPDPRTVLRARGWWAVRSPQPLVRSSHRPHPPTLPFGWIWSAAPQVLLPIALSDTQETVIVTPSPVPPPALPDHTLTTLPFMVGGQVMGLLTVALLAQATQTLIRSMHDKSVAHEPIVSPLIDAANLPSTLIDSPTLNGTAPTHAASPPVIRRVRAQRTWTSTAPAPDRADQSATDAHVEISTAAAVTHAPTDDQETNDPDRATAQPESISIAEGMKPQGEVDTVAELPANEALSDDQYLPPSAVSPEAITWPIGPGFSAFELGSLLHAMVQEPRLLQGRAGQVGLALPRIRSIYGIQLADARALLCWFDRAGLLAAPTNPLQPWLAPRPWRTTDLAEIACALTTTPLPTAADLADAFTRS